LKAFITGAGGFAGSHLTEHLVSEGDAVIGCSLSGTWPADVSAKVHRNVELMAWDISREISEDLQQRVAAFAPEWIFHLAAMSVPEECGKFEPTEEALRINAGGTQAVIELAAKLPSRPQVLLVSSARVYGAVSPMQPVVNEASPATPADGYGKSKLAAEHALLEAVGSGKVRGVIARAFNHTGPRQPDRFMLAEWCAQLSAAGGAETPLQVHSLDAYLDLSDVRDTVSAYRAMAQRAASGEIYNVGSGVQRRSGDILQELLEAAGIRNRPVRETKPGARHLPIADIARIQSVTRWRPRVPLAQTLIDTLDYWRRRTRAKLDRNTARSELLD